MRRPSQASGRPRTFTSWLRISGARSPWTSATALKTPATPIATTRAVLVQAGKSQPKPVTRSTASRQTSAMKSTPTQTLATKSSGPAARPSDRDSNCASGKLSHATMAATVNQACHAADGSGGRFHTREKT